MFNCVRSSILTNSVEIFADVHICFVADNFYFLIFEKHNRKIGELSSRKLNSGTFHCPGMDLAGTRDISFHSGTAPGNPGHLITLLLRSEVLPRPGQKFGSSFLLRGHRFSASGTTTSGTRASPKPGNSPKK